jgi:predicted DNA-binding antitoxin AbrB/MazE fold protein
MTQHVDAIYDDGVLKPEVPLSLPDKARVKITIETALTQDVKLQPHDEWERDLLRIAKDCGISLPDSAVSSNELYE